MGQLFCRNWFSSKFFQDSFCAMLFSFLVVQCAFGESQKVQSGDVQVKLVSYKVSISKGQEKLVEADAAEPGDIIEYQVSYENKGRNAVKDLYAVLPIPVGTSLVDNYFNPKENVEASVSGEKYTKFPLMRDVRHPDGKLYAEKLPLNEYRYLRWYFNGLNIGEKRIVSARVKVINSEKKK